MKMRFEEQYAAEVAALFERFPSVQNAPFGEAYKPGLERMAAFDALLGHPHRAYRTLHVAGTNGKGSVANLLASALSACGLRVGLYTSPHLTDFRERMRVAEDRRTDGSEDGAPAGTDTGGGSVVRTVPKEYVLDFILRYKADFERLQLSFFEITTAMALRWFADEQVDWAVIEVGLGGRLDSTNIITPDLSVVTSIGLDHCDLLGNTLTQIAAEKAGIFKPGVPAVVGDVPPETVPVFVEKAAETGSALHFAERETPYLWDRRAELLAAMDLQGAGQAANLRTVLTALDLLGIRHPAVPGALVRTAARMDFRGRWERLGVRPDVIGDMGHNAQALKGNFARLETLLREGRYTELIIVYGVMADKDLDAILPLLPSAATYVFTTPRTRRALPADRILDRYVSFCRAQGRTPENLHVRDAVPEAVGLALGLAEKGLAEGGEPLVFIGGSIFVLAEAVPCFPASRQG